MEKIPKHPKVFIIGAGFSGICAGIKLQQDLGIYNYEIFEENHDVGGTWLTSLYPGCACDVASHMYSYSFELNPNWSTSYAPQPEILAYLKGVAYKHDLYNRIKFHHQVKSAKWDEQNCNWKIVVHDKLAKKTSEYQCDIIISGIGGLRLPNIPEQFQPFKGPIIHSAKWNSCDLENKKVAVIGSGCSAVQIIPTIEPKVKQLISFQRNPAWVVPLSKFEIFYLVRWLFNKIPILMWLYRMFLFFSQEAKFVVFKANSRVRQLGKWMAYMFLKWQIPNNPQLRKKLMPQYELGCKRISPSNVYYKALNNPKCDVITEKITSVTERSIITEDGKEHQIDVLILATGYRVQDFFMPLKLYGVNSEDILETWKTFGPSHYLGIISNSLPNAFSLLGPNTAYGHNSVIFSIECQTHWIMVVLKEFIKRNAKVVSVKKSEEKQYMMSLSQRFKDTVWGNYKCGSWYENHLGINTTLYPGSLISYWNETKKPIFSNLSFY